MRPLGLLLSAAFVLGVSAVLGASAAARQRPRPKPASPPPVQEPSRAAPSTPERGRSAGRAPAEGRMGEGRIGARRGADADLASGYFDTCDANGDGWLSFRETRECLGLDQSAFAVYDQNRDGRCDPAEFRTRYEAILSRGGAFAPPRQPAAAKEPSGASGATEILARYDEDGNHELGLIELEQALASRRIRDIDPVQTLADFDADRSGSLDADEVGRLLLLRAVAPVDERRPTSIEELFGRAVVREEDPDRPPQPPQIVGPVPIFRRLDLDSDGGISPADLKELQRPLQIPVRIDTVFAALDRDGDGRISKDELRKSMER